MTPALGWKVQSQELTPVSDPLYQGENKEFQFRDTFVMPLLIRLGFGVVMNYHGQREFGRDVIFGDVDRFGHVVYYGMQIKYESSISLGDSHSLIQDAEGKRWGQFLTLHSGDAGAWLESAKSRTDPSIRPVVKLVATGSGRTQVDDLAQSLARGAATGLGDPRESPPDCVGAGGAPGERTTGPSLRRRRLGAANGATVRDGIHAAATRTTERIVRKDSRPLFYPFSLAAKGKKTVRIRVKTKSAEYTDWQWMVKKDGQIFRDLGKRDDFTVFVVRNWGQRGQSVIVFADAKMT